MLYLENGKSALDMKKTKKLLFCFLHVSRRLAVFEIQRFENLFLNFGGEKMLENIFEKNSEKYQYVI